MKEILSDFDIYLISLIHEELPNKNKYKNKDKLISVRLPNGESIVIDPVDVLHALLKSKEIEELSDINSDEIYVMNKKVKGKLIGGKIGQRDEHFGLSKNHPFWDWWHKKSKAHSGGRDIASAKEFDGYFDDYKNEINFLYAKSFIRVSINRLNSEKRVVARKILRCYLNVLFLGRS